MLPYNSFVRIKKFTCIRCGGPKVNPYFMPYIMCDFCGSLTDIDFTVGMEKWNESTFNQVWYTVKKMMFASNAQNALSRGDKDAYYLGQLEYWDFYYKTFPAYLPPTAADPKIYKTYIQVCAESSTITAFETKWQVYGAEQQALQAKVQMRIVNGQQKADSDAFFALAEFFVGITKEGMRAFYDNPRYEIMHTVLPERVHMKMRTSMFAQAWLPYLTDDDVDRLLKLLGFSNEYVEIEQPPGHYMDCGSCKTQVFAPDGSYRVYCEKCHTTTAVRSTFFCSGCGGQNDVPDDPSQPTTCERCGTTNRLIQPLFG